MVWRLSWFGLRTLSQVFLQQEVYRRGTVSPSVVYLRLDIVAALGFWIGPQDVTLNSAPQNTMWDLAEAPPLRIEEGTHAKATAELIMITALLYSCYLCTEMMVAQ